MDHCAKGWVPAQNTSTPSGSAARRTLSMVPRRSSTAAPTVSCTPVTISTVLRSNSLVTCGVPSQARRSPTASKTAAAVLDRSLVTLSTRATSHSIPIVGRGEPSNGTLSTTPAISVPRLLG
ncbi:Uncharacterised protein [Mycobacteroides abscessus subsp. abscessus]|nr:Uncharacterised protein [Mycobacteroides abscessus subsp. abscessus]